MLQMVWNAWRIDPTLKKRTQKAFFDIFMFFSISDQKSQDLVKFTGFKKSVTPHAIWNKSVLGKFHYQSVYSRKTSLACDFIIPTPWPWAHRGHQGQKGQILKNVANGLKRMENQSHVEKNALKVHFWIFSCFFHLW